MSQRLRIGIKKIQSSQRFRIGIKLIDSKTFYGNISQNVFKAFEIVQAKSAVLDSTTTIKNSVELILQPLIIIAASHRRI